MTTNGAIAPETLVDKTFRCSAVSLKRLPDRWAECEAYLRPLVPPDLNFRMVEAVDGKAYEHHLPDVDALEAALDIKLYRDWPVCDTEDLYRLFPDCQGLSDGEAWNWYRRRFRAFWNSSRAELFIDCYARQTTLGEIGCALSHLNIFDEAMRDSIDIQVIFEDDARPSLEALPVLLKEIAVLDKLGKQWDMIYLRSSKYDNEPEVPYVEGCMLLVAGHRKTTDAYVISRLGMGKINASGFRQNLFAIDDFLPSLYARHPRPDVEALSCVQTIREQGFIALVFPDSEIGDNYLCANLNWHSETNAATSTPVIGDEGMFECN